MAYRKTVIVYHTTPKEAFKNLYQFCVVKGLKYSTWSQRKLPVLYKNEKVEKIKVDEFFDAIEIDGKLIKVQ